MLTSKAFWESAIERAVKTFAQTALALLGTSQVVSAIEVNWAEVGGVAILAAILSILTSIAFPATEVKSAVRAEAARLASAKSATATKAPAKAKAASKPAAAKKPGTTKK
jgi:hypothetical protein